MIYLLYIKFVKVYTSRNGFDQGNKWTISGDQGRNWKEERVTLESLQFDDQV